MSFDEIPDRSDYYVAEGHIRLIGYFLKDILLICRNPHRHDSVSSFWHIAKYFKRSFLEKQFRSSGILSWNHLE